MAYREKEIEIPLTLDRLRYYQAPWNKISEVLSSRYPQKPEGIILLTSSGEFIGYMVWSGSFLAFLEVSQKFRGKGYGAYLLQRGIESGGKELLVDSVNQKAIKLYESFGFREIKNGGTKIHMGMGYKVTRFSQVYEETESFESSGTTINGKTTGHVKAEKAINNNGHLSGRRIVKRYGK